MAVYDPIRAEQERIENEAQNARAEFERSKPQPGDTASVRARKKSGRDRVRASAEADQNVREQYQAKYTGRVKSTPKSAPSSKVGSGWTLEGNYGTRKDANTVARNLKSSGMFTMVRRMGDGSYNVWKREGATVKSYKLGLGKKDKKGRGDKERELAPPTEARWVDFGTLPEYKPPNFQLDKSGYKPLDYKPLETKPMFQYTGFKTMEYKPIGDQPYYRKFEYRPIGQFGGGSNSYVTSSEPAKRKRRKSKEPRMVGE